MNIDTLIKNINCEIYGDTQKRITLLSQDTREDYSPETLYFAVVGTQVDGHDYIDQAIEKGACCIVCEKLPLVQKSECTYIIVDSVAQNMGRMVSEYYGNPTLKMKVIAVTGTNGKTTVATALYQSLSLLGQRTALFSTAGDFIGSELINANRKAGTSMEIIEFHKYAKKARDAGCDYLCIEATSHALDQARLGGIEIDIAVFTNLTQDHLNYHITMENYAKAKKKLFDSLSSDAYAIINSDDAYGLYMVQDCKAPVCFYRGREENMNSIHDILFSVQDFDFQGTHVTIDGAATTTKCVGLFNMYNLAAVYGCLRKLGFEKKESINGISNINGAPGRMELVTCSQKEIIGIVDYAHTPDALENVLQTLKELPHNNIITVVGAGGDRDRTKRPLMGSLAQNNSDYVFFTSDNPRTEDIQQIFEDIQQGCNPLQANFEFIVDRDSAIEKACKIAKNKDIILVAGKGHEKYQIIGSQEIPFDDVTVLHENLKK